MSEEFTIRGKQIFLGDRLIGWLTRTGDGRKIFCSPRNRTGITKQGTGHYFEMFKGFAIAESVLAFLERNQFDEVHLKIGRAETLIASLKTWREQGIPYQHTLFEKQLVLPERLMQKERLTLTQLAEGLTS